MGIRRRGALMESLFTVVLLMLVAMATGKIFKNENACLSQGGICAEATSCPPDRQMESGLCTQKDSVCCSGVPENVNSCHLHGGRCGDIEACENVQQFGKMDCKDGKSCCLLIY